MLQITTDLEQAHDSLSFMSIKYLPFKINKIQLLLTSKSSAVMGYKSRFRSAEKEDIYFVGAFLYQFFIHIIRVRIMVL